MSEHVSSRGNAPSQGPLREILEVWRPFFGRLAFGMILSLAAVAAGLALMANAGARLSGMALGAGLAFYGLRAIGLGRIILRYAERLYTHDVTFRALAALRVWFFRQLARGAAAGLGFRRTGDLLTRLVSDIETLDNLYLRLAIPLAGAVITLPILMWVGLTTGPAIGIVVVILFILAAFVAPYVAARATRPSGELILTRESALRESALDLAQGLREARAFGAERMLAQAVTQRQERLFAAQRTRAGQFALAGGFSYLIGQIALIAVVLSALGLGLPRTSPLATIALLFLTVAAFESVSGLVRAGVLAGEVSHAAQRIVEIAHEAPAAKGTAPLPSGTALALEHVAFRWAADRAPVFDDLSLTIAPGERLAIIGPSGAGKSSLAALLLKAAAPQSGRILLDGVDTAALDDDALRSRVAWLSQHTHLFADTIRRNLTLGRTDMSDDALFAALDRAAVGDVVRSLPEGLDTWLGEGGMTLSGGQGRRIALARTLLSDAPILILDEPATGLDAETERAFLTTLYETTAGRTVLLIAHRLTGAERLDKVWLLQNGHLAAQPV